MERTEKYMQDYIIRKLENDRAIWFRASKLFLLLAEPAFDVFRLYTGAEESFSGSPHGGPLDKPLKGEPIDKIINHCEKKYGHIESDIPQFVEEVIQTIDHGNRPENEVTVTVEPPKNIDWHSVPFEEVVSYRIGRKVITLGYQSGGLKKLVHPGLAHLGVATQKSGSQIIGVYEQQGILFFTREGEIVDAFKKENEHYFTGCLRQLMFGILYNCGYNDWMMALHASAVARNGEAVVFSAAGGSGKSTVSALLKAQGYHFLTDDFITAGHNHRVYPFPATISVKEGSLETLSAFYPELQQIQPQVTRIGKRVRHLPVENLTGDYENGFPVKAFVFVKYDAEAEPLLERVSQKEALGRLLEESWVNPEPESVEKFFDWVEHTHFYRLRYSRNRQLYDYVNKIFSS